MLLNQWIRVFHDDNGTFKDLSIALQNNTAVDFPFIAAEDKLYISQNMPFNNFFMELDTVNDTSTAITVEAWDGQNWKPVVDILDGTSAGGVSLSVSGVIQYSPDRDEIWDSVEDTRDEPVAFGIPSSIVLYDSYWLRVSWSSDLNAATKLRKLAYYFATDEQLQSIDPEINNYLTSWESGKTTWAEQIILSSQILVSDLAARGMIVHPGQVLRFEDVSLATTYRTLALIYNTLGQGFEFQRDDALKQYSGLLSVKRFTFDKNKNAQVDRGELFNTVGKGVR